MANLPRPADPLIIEWLTGARIDHEIEPGLTRVAATVRLEDFLGTTERSKERWRSYASRATVLGGWCTRRQGRGEANPARHPCAHGSAHAVHAHDGAALIREDRVRTLADLLQRALLRGWLPCVDGLELVAADDHPKRDAVREVLRDHAGPLATDRNSESQRVR